MPGLKQKMSVGAAVIALMLATFLLFRTRSDNPNEPKGPRESAGKNPRIASGDSGVSASSTNPEPPVSEQDETVRGARQKLHSLELGRISFSREYEDEENVYYEYLIAAPTKEERLEISQICSSVKGLSKDWFDGSNITGSQKLRSEFLLPSQYSHVSVSVQWPKGSRSGSYSLVGIEAGKLTYLPNGSPSSSDGKVNIIRIGTQFEFDSDWRFAHVLEFDNKK
jgi:hypothetical protein